MTVAVSFQGAGRQFTANIGTDTVTIVKYNGSGGTPSAAAADGSIEGSTALTVQVNKQGVAMFVTLPSALDFSGGGTEEGELIYIWANFLASSLLNTQAANGFGICLSSGTPTTSNYSLFSFYGSDNYAGGWKRLVLDPTKTRSGGAGTLTLSNITHIGVFADVGGSTARFDNLVMDACDVGTGLKVTGTSTLGLIEELLANEATNRYGIVTALNDSETSVELAGKLTLGDNSGTLSSNITDEDSKIFIAEPLYYQGSEQAAVPLGFAGIEVVGNGTGDTNVTIGQPVGTDQGRNGISLVGNDTYNTTFDRDDGNVEASDWYGCSFEKITGAINLDGNHDFNGNTMSSCGAITVADGAEVKNLTSVSCGQIDLNATGKLTDSLIINNTAASSVLTSDLDNVSGCSFTSDGSNHAVELDSIAASPMIWNNKLSNYVVGAAGSPATTSSTGNEAVYSNVGTGTLDINVAAGADVPSIRTAGETVNVVESLVPVTLSNIVAGSMAYIEALPGGSLTAGDVMLAPTVINTDPYNAPAQPPNQPFKITVANASGSPKYIRIDETGNTGANGYSRNFEQQLDE